MRACAGDRECREAASGEDPVDRLRASRRVDGRPGCAEQTGPREPLRQLPRRILARACAERAARQRYRVVAVSAGDALRVDVKGVRRCDMPAAA